MVFGDRAAKCQQSFDRKIVFLKRIALEFIDDDIRHRKGRLPTPHLTNVYSLSAQPIRSPVDRQSRGW